MTLESLTNGKFLKPFICLVKLKYLGPSERRSEDKLLHDLKGAFPYYSESDLRQVIDNFQKHLSEIPAGSRRDQLSKWYNYFYNHRYSQEAEQISSPDLYHFVKREYLLTILQNEFLYPTALGLTEYKSLLREYDGCFAKEKDELLQNENLLERWQSCSSKISELIGKGKKVSAFNSYIKKESFLPAVNCFTELPVNQIGLHADHYGSYGICFRKDQVVLKEFLFSSEIETMRHIRPIYYCDNSKCSLPWLILNKMMSNPKPTREDERKLMSDLALLKPIDRTLLSPKNLYSVIYEREWRYVSFESLFTFKRKMIKRVLISRADYQRWLEGKEDKVMENLVAFCQEHNIFMDMV
ncbi:MAG: abortive infection system antitoxin AbiGi family protein [Bdellovibrionota bacterium]